MASEAWFEDIGLGDEPTMAESVAERPSLESRKVRAEPKTMYKYLQARKFFDTCRLFTPGGDARLVGRGHGVP